MDGRLRLLGSTRLTDGFKALEGLFALRALPPGVGNAADIGESTQLFIGLGVAVVGMTCGGGDEHIDTHLSLRLTTVGDEIADIAQFVDCIHIIVGF